MSTLSIRDLDLRNKRVFMRVDFNVPLAPGGKEITSDKRIKASLPSIQYALDHGAALILASHLGRPKGKPNPEMTLQPVAERLAALLGRRIAFAPDCVGPLVTAMLPKPGEVLLLENLRFHAEGDKIEAARELMAASGDNLLLPVDHAVARESKAGAENEVVERVPEGTMALAMGPKTIERYSQVIAGAKTVIWNGPMGVFEMPPFDKGTVALAKAVAASGAVSGAAGGECETATKNAGAAGSISTSSAGAGGPPELLG